MGKGKGKGNSGIPGGKSGNYKAPVTKMPSRGAGRGR